MGKMTLTIICKTPFNISILGLYSSTNTIEMSLYIDQAIETPLSMGTLPDDLQRIRDFQAVELPATKPYIRRKSLECVSKFHSFDQVSYYVGY